MYTNLQRPFHAIHLHNTPPWLYPQHQDQSCITATPCAPCPLKYSYFALQDTLTILPSSLTPNFAIMHYATHPSNKKGLHQYITFHKPQDPLSPEECPPTHATRYICSVLQAVNVWHHPSALACFCTLSQHPAWDFMNSDTTAAQHALLNIHDIPNPKSIPSHLHPWYWSTSQHPLPNFYTVATARLHRVQWHLFTTHAAIQAINENQRLRVHCFFKSHHHSTSTIWSPHPHATNIYKAFSQNIQVALQNKNLTEWARLLQARVPFLPYETNPLLQLVRSMSGVAVSYTSVSPPVTLIYVAVHSHLLCCYVGKTTFATTQRLRKHVTTTQAGSEESTFHDALRRTSEVDSKKKCFSNALRHTLVVLGMH